MGGTSSKRKGRTRDTLSVQPPVAKLEKFTAEAEGGRGGADAFRSLRAVLEGVVDLAGHEEALFQQVVMCL